MQPNTKTLLVPAPQLERGDKERVKRVTEVVGNLSYVHHISFLIVQYYLVNQETFEKMLTTLHQRTLPDQLTVYEGTKYSFLEDMRILVDRFVKYYQQHGLAQEVFQQLRRRGEYLDVAPHDIFGGEDALMIRAHVKPRTIQ